MGVMSLGVEGSGFRVGVWDLEQDLGAPDLLLALGGLGLRPGAWNLGLRGWNLGFCVSCFVFRVSC